VAFLAGACTSYITGSIIRVDGGYIPASDPLSSFTGDKIMNEEDKESIRRRFLAVDTSNVADGLDTLGLPD
jgi:hypothetical protein